MILILSACNVVSDGSEKLSHAWVTTTERMQGMQKQEQ